MNRSLAIVMATITMSSAGIGLTLPVLPQLLRDVGHTGAVDWRYGALIALYALMQFIFSPILGSLSDRIGRRPVLLVSLAGAVVDYLFLAFAPTLWMVFLGRAIAGITGANMAVASAYIADVTPEHQRTRRFGQLSACFGVGFIVGPVLGGLFGQIWVRAPFLAAAALDAVNLCLALAVLRESRPAGSAPAAPLNFLPLESLRWASGFAGMLPLLLVYAVLTLVGEVGGTVWVLYGEDKFAWDSLMIGLSLAGFGLFHALAQAFVAGPAVDALGERRAILAGIGFDAVAYLLIAFATKGWMAFALLPVFCIGGIGAPALQALLSAKAGDDRQGQLQGVMTSMASLASIVGPLVISAVYFASRATFPGLVWVVGAALYLLCLPTLMGAGRHRG